MNTTVPAVETDQVKDITSAANYFSELAAIDVSNYIEKKNGFSYLSWAFATDQLKRIHPDAVINVKRFPDPDMGGMLVPFLKTSLGVFVEVEVIINGVSVSEPFPVLDFRNKPIEKPNAMDINKALQRAKVKAIAGHGLGLYIYAGEDLPIESDDYNVQDSYQQAPPQQYQQPSPQPNAMTDEQKQRIRELANELSVLTGLALPQVFGKYQITAHMTQQQAAATMEAMQSEIKAFHDERMAKAQGQQAAQNSELFAGAPAEDLSNMI